MSSSMNIVGHSTINKNIKPNPEEEGFPRKNNSFLY